MEHFRVKRFEGAYTDWDETDSERGSLRQVRGLMFGHMGALSSMPPALDSGDLYAAANALGLASCSLLRVDSGGTVYIASFNPNLGEKYRFTFIAPVRSNLGGTIPGINGALSVTVLESGFDEDARWFGSRCGEYLIMGNGVDDNKVFECRTNVYRDLGFISGTVDAYAKSRVHIPPCTSFAVNQAGVLFASGNTTNYNRVWITDQPDIKTPVMVERVRSLSYSYVDVGSAGGGTTVTALSVVRDYVLAHIYNDRPVMLYAFDTNGVQGWRCRQVSSELKSSAPNPGCVVDGRGDSAYFLGSDCEVYKDVAVAPASSGEAVARSGKIVTNRGAGAWNESITRATGLQSSDTRIAFHEGEDLFFILATSNGSTATGLYVVNTGTLSYSGPLTLPATAMCVTEDALVLVIDGRLRVYEVAALGSVEFKTPSAGQLAAVQPLYTNPGVSATGTPRVGVNTTALTFLETVFGESYSVAAPFAKMTAGTPAGVNLWYNNARLCYFETGYEDFGDPASLKDFVEFHLTLRRNSVCAIGIVAETEAGVVRKNWRGLVTNTETLKTFFNMKGRRVRFRVYVVAFEGVPCAVLDFTIGWLAGVVK